MLSISFGFPNLFGSKVKSNIDIESVKIHDIDTGRDKLDRTIKHLIKLNHAKHAILFHDMQFHNHMPHILGSAYLLKGTPSHLDDIYEEESKTLSPWRDSPNEVSAHDWRDYLGDRRYQRAYIDFFEDETVMNGYDWKKVVNKYLFEGKEPLFNCLIAGLGHPLIHLGYAFELSSREIAMEALGLATTQYSFLHKYLDDPKYTQPPSPSSSSSPSSTSPTTDPLAILSRIATDPRFAHNADSITAVFDHHETALLEHWNSWLISDPKTQFKASQHAATALLVAVRPLGDGPKKQFNFFLVHLLTTSHAVRILLPLIPSEWHVPLLRQWWLITLAVYVAQGRPTIDLDNILHSKSGDEGKGGDDDDWKTILFHAVDKENPNSLDAHYVKALRAMKVAAETWGDPEDYYLKAAGRFDREFDGWGFGSAAVPEGAEGHGSGRRGSAAGI